MTAAPAAIAAAKAAAPAGKASSRPALASTGGGSNSLPIALAGAGVLAVGAATLLVLRRRKGDHS
jgi:LPXTG-motif cell wall-anchored protein